MALKDRFVTSDLDGRARLWCRRHPLVQGLKRNDCVSNIHVVLIINDDCFVSDSDDLWRAWVSFRRWDVVFA